MQFAFGSKIVKPGPSKTGVGSTAGDARSKTQGGAVADGGSNAPIRPRRSVLDICLVGGDVLLVWSCT